MSEAYCKACERDDFANCEAREEEPCCVCGQRCTVRRAQQMRSWN